MSEQEIFDHLEKMCVLDELCYEVDCLDEKDLEVIRELIKLYNKQKEEIEEEKEKWKELFHEYNKLVGEVIDKEHDLKDSISKDKIRDKIKKLEYTYQCEEEENGYNDETYMYYIPQIKVLKEMLGELNNE